MNIYLVGVLAPMMLNFLLLFCRKGKWAQNVFRWVFVSLLFVVGLILFLFNNSHKLEDADFALWGLMTPGIFSIIDYGFNRLSQLIHHRNYYLWLRGSSQIDDLTLKFKASDRIFQC